MYASMYDVAAPKVARAFQEIGIGVPPYTADVLPAKRIRLHCSVAAGLPSIFMRHGSKPEYRHDHMSHA